MKKRKRKKLMTKIGNSYFEERMEKIRYHKNDNWRKAYLSTYLKKLYWKWKLTLHFSELNKKLYG